MLRRSRLHRMLGGRPRAQHASVREIPERQLEETAVACELARAVAEGRAAPGDAREKAAEIEHEGDVVRAELVTRLQDVLDSPLSREDLFRLSRSIDDVLDNLRDFVREWDLYQVTDGGPFLKIIDAVATGVSDLRLAVRTIAGGADDTRDSALASKKSANEVRRLYDLEVAHLVSGELSMEVLKSRELLRRLDVVGLRLNEAADVLADAAVKRQS